MHLSCSLSFPLSSLLRCPCSFYASLQLLFSRLLLTQRAERSRPQCMGELKAKSMTPCAYTPWKDAALHPITAASQSFSMKLLL